MESNIDLKRISIAVVIALIIGAGAGYMVGNSPVSSLMEVRYRLEVECDSLSLAVHSLTVELISTQVLLAEEQRENRHLMEEYSDMFLIEQENQELLRRLANFRAEITVLQNDYQHMFDEYEELHDYYMELEENYTVLQAAFESLNQSYSALQETYELYNVNLYKEIPFNITRQGAGYIDRYFDFDLGYGIICTTYIKVNTETYGSIQIGSGSYWTRGGEGGFMGSSGRTYTQLEITLTGYAYCRVFDSGGHIQVEIGVRPRNQTSWHGRQCEGTFPKELS